MHASTIPIFPLPRLRRFFLGLAVGTAGLFVLGLAHAAERNVVLFVTDDQSPDFGAYGNPVLQTPNLDAIAADGTRFDYAFCTTASCSASRSVILSGLHNHANGHYGHQHRYHKFNSYANLLTLPVYLKHAGYRTARCGKFHVAPEKLYDFGQSIPGNTRSPVAMAENCKTFLSEESDKPFFLYICTSDPHRGGGSANELPHKPDRFGNPRTGSKGYPGVKEVKYGQPGTHPGFLGTPTCGRKSPSTTSPSPASTKGWARSPKFSRKPVNGKTRSFSSYRTTASPWPEPKPPSTKAACVPPASSAIPYLKKRGVATDAMISWVDLAPSILDFAGALDAQGKLAPKVSASLRSNLPTGEQNGRHLAPGKFHGRSFLSILDKEKPQGWDQVHASHTFHEITMYYPMRVVRERRYKLIWNIAHPLPFPFASDLWASPTWQAQYKLGPDAPYGAKTVRNYVNRPAFELYDLVKDPHEGRNLADSPDHANILARLKSKPRAFSNEPTTRGP